MAAYPDGFRCLVHERRGGLAADVSYPSVLGGTVVSITPAGTAVKQGDVLLTVDSLAGPMPAARAASDGVVKQVLVSPGNGCQGGNCR